MTKIKELFETIGKYDIDENKKNLFSSGDIDSLDIMALVGVIEQKYGSLDIAYIEAENFENFETIAKMLKDAYKS